MKNHTHDASGKGLNRAKPYQLVLFPLNNGATNVYFVLILSYVAQFGSSILHLGIFASLMVTIMRVCDAITDPIIGAMMDRTSTRIGKFRPFMILGSVVMALSVIALYILLPLIPDTMMPARYVGFTVVYFIWVLGYTFQTSVTRAGQTVLTNDPNQRPMFTIFNTVGSLLGMGIMQFLIPLVKAMYDVKDAAGCKLALAIATNTTVLLALYGIVMGNYNSLYLPMMVLGYVCAVPFFLLSMRTSQKKGQRASLIRYVSVALICYVGVLVLLLVSDYGNPSLMLSFPFEGGGAINLYTILFILFFGVGYGAYYATADMPIPMVADCSDYETYRSGKYIPGIMGTMFSLVDKLVSSLAQTLVAFIFLACAGLADLPTDSTPYSTGIKVAVIVTFCIIPMLAWAATLLAMKGYTLTGAKMKEIQAVNAARKTAIEQGMSLEEAMERYQTVDQVPEQLRN